MKRIFIKKTEFSNYITFYMEIANCTNVMNCIVFFNINIAFKYFVL